MLVIRILMTRLVSGGGIFANHKAMKSLEVNWKESLKSNESTI